MRQPSIFVKEDAKTPRTPVPVGSRMPAMRRTFILSKTP
jgi:hypothetical protein